MGKIKAQWHKENKSEVFHLTGGECFRCGKNCQMITQGVAHHHTYKEIDGKSVYSYSGKEALELGIVDWCCNNCHHKIHESESIDGCTRVLEKCYICKKRYGDFTRASLLNLDRPICRKCFKAYKKQVKIEASGQLNLFNNFG